MTPQREKLITGLIFGAAGLAVLVLVALNGNRKSPNRMTVDRLATLEQAVRSFAVEHGRAPESLDELGLPEEHLQDHLGEPFRYTVDRGRVSLVSYGSDKKPGGKFFKRDFRTEFSVPE